MDGIDLGPYGDADNVFDVQVGLNRSFAGTNLITLVCLGDVKCKAVLVRKDGNCANAKFIRRAQHTNGDFTAIGDQ